MAPAEKDAKRVPRGCKKGQRSVTLRDRCVAMCRHEAQTSKGRGEGLRRRQVTVLRLWRAEPKQRHPSAA
ncbi:hypothetical protein EYF80_055746 [Liparis tanakae]|uniref:Uncharacterized protein n=1 Tax=Liparis tanakae TaxID=230148 RepID=A0A4Z2EYY3_9TELE|nr:hypothetical protein EYF80_055746 [Liparis tanakae]